MQREQRNGIIDTLTLGYGLINRRPWLIVLPILLDLFLWLGPRLSADGVLDSLLNVLAQQDNADEATLTSLRELAAGVDLFAALAIQVPSFVRAVDPSMMPPSGRAVLALGSPLIVVGAGIVLLLAGLLIAAIYLSPIGLAVRTGRIDLPDLAGLVRRSWIRLAALVGLAILASVGIALPLSIVAAVLAIVGINVVMLLIVLMQVALIWLLIYLYFVPEAIIVSDAGPLRAIRNSFLVVRNNFWSTLGLILLMVIISAGMVRGLERMAFHPVGLVAGILIHAYIGTGLAAASMIFYRDRFARWEQQQRASTLSRIEPGASR